MTKGILKLAAALAVIVASLAAQTGGVAGSPFQQAGQLSAGPTQPMGGVQMTGLPQPATAGGWITLAPGGRGSPQAVVGKPFSATEERRTVQTLGDGTQLENSDSNLYYRDSQGRTRVEQTVQGRTRIVITDPVAHTTVVLDPATKKTARKNGAFVFCGTKRGTNRDPRAAQCHRRSSSARAAAGP